MSRLVVAAFREMLGVWGLPVLFGWLVAAGLLAAESDLGSGSLGEYLAMVAVAPMVVLLRAAAVVERRRREGWPAEERLRDRRGWRMPCAEFGGATFLLLLTLSTAILPPVSPALRPADRQGSSSHPFDLRVDGDAWEIDLGGEVRRGASLEIAAEFPVAPRREVRVGDGAGRAQPILPGSLFVWSLSDEEARTGRFRLHVVAAEADADAKPSPLAPLARLRIPRPGLARLPFLLFEQFLYFLPLLALTLLLARNGGVRAGFAALGALGMGALAIWDPPDAAHAGGSFLAWGVRTCAAIAELLPDVGPLLAIGHAFERSAGLADPLAVGAWLLFGLVCTALSTWRPPTPRR